MTRYEKLAAQLCDAIKTIAAKPENLANFENYLSHHFPVWLARYAYTPSALVGELKMFAEMEV